MSDPPRSRRQTRAAILARLHASNGLFRPRLAADVQLTEGSISRILAELRAEGLVEELRRPAPYPGGPTGLVALRKDQRVIGLEFANGRLGAGIATLAGELDTATRLDLPPGADPLATAAQAIAGLAAWCRQHAITPRQIAACLPGHRGATHSNPILPIDPERLAHLLRQAFPGVPLALANTATAQAAVHLHGRHAPPIAARHLFVYLGHGIGGAWVDPVTAEDPIQPVEIGHVVLDPQGAQCRCGHRGCLEASASTVALAALCAVPEDDLLAAGPDWPSLVRMSPRRQSQLRDVLGQIGLVLGNALNLCPVSDIVLCGWPAALPEALRDAVAEGMRASLFGAEPALRFLPPLLREPEAALAYAVHELIRQGGSLRPAEPSPERLAG